MAVYRRFTEEFKAQAVELALESGNITKTAHDIGIGGSTLNQWVRAHKMETANSSGSETLSPADALRIRQLEKENVRLSMENEFLKKAAAFFAKTLLP
jgi:transposase-like protein